MMNNQAIGILGTGAYVPSMILDNATLAKKLGVDTEWIVQKTGIHERRIAASYEATSDLATCAGKQALQNAQLSANDVDLIIIATSSPDWIQPATACVVQSNLGATRAVAFDISAVCTGFVYAMEIAQTAIVGNPNYRTALVIGAETYSRILNYEDRKTCILFGDGAGAVVVGRVSEPYGIIASSLGADGSKAHLINIPAGGSRQPTNANTIAAQQHFFQMDGRGVRSFLETMLPRITAEAFNKSRLLPESVDLVIPHQANGVILRSCLEPLGFTDERVHYTFQKYGNTGAASVAITLDDAVRMNRIDKGDTLLMMAFGGGMTWGSMVMRWANQQQLSQHLMGSPLTKRWHTEQPMAYS